MPTGTKLTAEAFFRLPDPPNGDRMELRAGETVFLPARGWQEGGLVGDVGSAVLAFSRLHHLGPAMVSTGFVLRRHPDTVLGPAVSFVANERLDPARDREWFIEGAPTLAVEVVRPDQVDSDVDEKVSAYLAAGTERVWVVRPRGRTVTVHRPDGEIYRYRIGDVLSSDDAGFAVDGFALPLADLFGDD